MNLKNYIARLQELADKRPDLADADIIVRNVQGRETIGTLHPNGVEVNADPPYWLGRIAGLDIDQYFSHEDATYFRSDYTDIDGLWYLLDETQTGDYYDPTELPDDEVRRRVDALPWKEAIVADIGVAE